MGASTPDTVHGRFIEHMQLARRVAGPRASEARVLRLMERHTPDELRRMVVASVRRLLEGR